MQIIIYACELKSNTCRLQSLAIFTPFWFCAKNPVEYSVRWIEGIGSGDDDEMTCKCKWDCKPNIDRSMNGWQVDMLHWRRCCRPFRLTDNLLSTSSLCAFVGQFPNRTIHMRAVHSGTMPYARVCLSLDARRMRRRPNKHLCVKIPIRHSYFKSV